MNSTLLQNRLLPAVVGLTAFLFQPPRSAAESPPTAIPVANQAARLRPAGVQPHVTAVRGFVPNAGQLPNPDVRFALRDRGVSAYFTDSGFVLWGGQSTVTLIDGEQVRTPVAPRWQLVGARPLAPDGGETFPHTVSYFRGNDPTRWRPHLPAYRDIRYPGILRGVEMRVETRDRGFEYTFHLEPGARPELRFRYEGITSLELTPMGDLLVQTAAGSFTESRPVSYQVIDGQRREVESLFELVGSHEYRIVLGPHDETHSLVVDPVLDWSTFLGKTHLERLREVEVDPAGNVIVAGDTLSTDFEDAAAFSTGPGVTYNANLNEWHEDVFIAKFTPDGSQLLWVGYLAGSGVETEVLGFKGLAVDDAGDIYVGGVTWSTDFPGSNVTPHSGVSDAFVTKILSDGSDIHWSTLLGGSEDDWGWAICLDSAPQPNLYVAGSTHSTTGFGGTFGGARDIFVARLDAFGAIDWSSYLGGDSDERAAAMVADGSHVYVFGDTQSPDFAALEDGTFSTTLRGNDDAFIAKLAADGSGIDWWTYLGGTAAENDLSSGSFPATTWYLNWSRGDIALDTAGNILVAGQTYSSDFPVTAGAYQTTLSGNSDGYVAKFGSGGDLLWATFLGGPGSGASMEEIAWGLAVNPWDEIFIVGRTDSSSFPVTADAVQTTYQGGGQDGFISKFSANGSALLYSSYLGSSEPDVALGTAYHSGNVFVTAWAVADDFPTTTGAFQTDNHSWPDNTHGDGFLMKFLDAYLAHDGFETDTYSGGSGWSAAWSKSGDASILTSAGPHAGSRHIRLRRGTGQISRTFAVLPGAATLRLGFWTRVHSFEGSDSAEVRVSGVPGAVAVFNSADSDNIYRYVEVDISDAIPQGQVQITFDANMGDTGDNWYLDDIRITGTQGNMPPVANAGPDQSVIDADENGFEWITLDGSASADIDGEIVGFEWSPCGAPPCDSPSLTVSAGVGTTTIYTLTVTDDEGDTDSDTVEITVTAPPLGPIEVFADGFEDGALSPWTQDSQNDWFVGTTLVFEGVRAANVDGSASNATLSSPVIDLQGRTSATITFAWYIGTSLDNGEYLACEVSTNGGGSWAEVGRLSGRNGSQAPEGSWQSAVIGIPSAPAGTLHLRFLGKMNSTDEFAAVDDLRVVAE